MTPSKKKAKVASLKYGYRSGLEEEIGKGLVSKGIDPHYESFKIKWTDHKVRTYTPDFILPNGIIIESKGRFVQADRRKHLEIKKQYPEYDIRFVFSNPNAKLSKVSKTTYAQWCKRYDFKYAYLDIPQEWIDEPPKDTWLLKELGLK